MCLAKLPPRPFPAPGEPPASICLRWVRPWLAEKRAARHLVCIGPSVFCGGFTKYTLSNKTPLPAAPPEMSVADLERIRIEKAKARIHQVMLRFFPSCQRLSRLREYPPRWRLR